MPPRHRVSHPQERTFPLLGSLDGNINGVFAECLFVDQIADLAVLAEPDKQAMCDEAERYQELIGGAPTLTIAKARTGRGWVLSLKGRWVQVEIKAGLSLAIGRTEAGMSGSPILNDNGRAVGVVAISEDQQPILVRELPGWVLVGSLRRA